MENVYFYLIIGILTFNFIFERVLDWLNGAWRTKPIPKELDDVYDKEKYQQQQEYLRVNSRFSAISLTFSFVIGLLFLIFRGFGKLHYFLANYIDNPVLLGLAYFGVLLVSADILSMPFAFYRTFVIEERFGFNKTTPKVFITDKIKEYILGAIIGGVLYTIIYKFYVYSGKNFWIYAWIVVAIFMLFMSMFYSNLIVPLFNKQKPLPDGNLKSEITAFADKVGFKIHDIYVINGSKRSTKANAYFTGFGPKKRIVLYDTLINQMTKEELVAVLVHEIGHYKKRHTVIGLVLSLLQMLIMMYLLSLFISDVDLSMALGVSTPQFHVGLIAFALIYSPVSTVMGLLMNIISRKNEYEADKFAADNYDGEYLITALKKLSSNNLSNLTPHPLYVWVNYSHPSLYQRILNLREQNH